MHNLKECTPSGDLTGEFPSLNRSSHVPRIHGQRRYGPCFLLPLVPHQLNSRRRSSGVSKLGSTYRRSLLLVPFSFLSFLAFFLLGGAWASLFPPATYLPRPFRSIRVVHYYRLREKTTPGFVADERRGSERTPKPFSVLFLQSSSFSERQSFLFSSPSSFVFFFL